MAHFAWISNIKPILTANVPVLKMQIDCKYQVDLSFLMSEHLGLQSTELVLNYLSLVPWLKQLGVLFKMVVKSIGGNNVYEGGISSYTIILMVIAYV